MGQLLIAAFHEKVFAVDRATGEIRWRVKLDLGNSAVELAIDDTTVIACTRAALAFIDYATGEVRRTVQRTAVKAMRPVMLLDGSHLFIGGSGEVACYAITGQLVWEQAFKGEGYGELALGFPHRVRQADVVD
jgi:outer membrane protein assembly factor BamB